MPLPPPEDPTQRAYERPDVERPASSSPTVPDLESESPGGILAVGHDPYVALQFRDYRLYAIGYVISVIGQQMLGVAVGWELYERTHSAMALGLVGLVQALPIIVLALPAGHTADVVDRKRLVLITQVLVALGSIGLVAVSFGYRVIPMIGPLRQANVMLRSVSSAFGETGARFDDAGVPLIYWLLFLIGVARAFNDPARAALLPRIVPAWAFANAVTWNSSAFQVASMTGPALGGLLLGLGAEQPYSFAVVYLADASCALLMAVLILPIAGRGPSQGGDEPLTFRTLAAGLRFVWETKIILATITLDLFAVLFGGAVALLPVFAAEILHVGATGLGWLRAAPSMGAFLMALVLAHLPPMRRAGKTLLWAVAGFGMATIVFGLSRSFWLSLAMLMLAGALDNISVVVRHTLVQMLTPDAMRGRVSAVNNVFIGSSNELGALESGLTAAAFGPVLSVVGGGIGTILVVLAVAWIWPQVRQLGPLDDPERTSPASNPYH
jgi:MFS family permease